MNTKETMEVKEAIKILSEVTNYDSDDEPLVELEHLQVEDIISLLQQGETLKVENEELKAYKLIVKELKEFYGNGILENEGGFGVQLFNLIEILEGKYLEKEAKSDES